MEPGDSRTRNEDLFAFSFSSFAFSSSFSPASLFEAFSARSVDVASPTLMRPFCDRSPCCCRRLLSPPGPRRIAAPRPFFCPLSAFRFAFVFASFLPVRPCPPVHVAARAPPPALAQSPWRASPAAATQSPNGPPSNSHRRGKKERKRNKQVTQERRREETPRRKGKAPRKGRDKETHTLLLAHVSPFPLLLSFFLLTLLALPPSLSLSFFHFFLSALHLAAGRGPLFLYPARRGLGPAGSRGGGGNWRGASVEVGAAIEDCGRRPPISLPPTLRPFSPPPISHKRGHRKKPERPSKKEEKQKERRGKNRRGEEGWGFSLRSSLPQRTRPHVVLCLRLRPSLSSSPRPPFHILALSCPLHAPLQSQPATDCVALRCVVGAFPRAPSRVPFPASRCPSFLALSPRRFWLRFCSVLRRLLGGLRSRLGLRRRLRVPAPAARRAARRTLPRGR